MACRRLLLTSSRPCSQPAVGCDTCTCSSLLQGEIRVGPDLVTNPALHVTREMEDRPGAWGFPMPIDTVCHRITSLGQKAPR